MKKPSKRKSEIEPIPHINHEAPIPQELPEFIPEPSRENPIPELIPLSNPEIEPIKEDYA